MTFEYWIKTDCQMLIRFDFKKTPKTTASNTSIGGSQPKIPKLTFIKFKRNLNCTRTQMHIIQHALFASTI